MRWIPTIAIILVCAACQSPQVATVPPAEPVCHDFATPVTAGGRPEQARGQACEQPDGSWQVVQNTPGLPAQTYVLEPPGQPTAAREHPCTAIAEPVPTQPVGMQQLYGSAHGRRTAAAGHSSRPVRNPTGAGRSRRIRRGCRRRSTRCHRPRPRPTPTTTRTRSTTPIPSSFRIGSARRGTLASRRRSSSCRGSIISIMAFLGASGTVSPAVLALASGLPAAAEVADDASRDGVEIMSVQAIGQPVRREEDLRLLKGRGRYVDDIREPNEARGYVLRSPHAHARISALDARRALGRARCACGIDGRGSATPRSRHSDAASPPQAAQWRPGLCLPAAAIGA